MQVVEILIGMPIFVVLNFNTTRINGKGNRWLSACGYRSEVWPGVDISKQTVDKSSETVGRIYGTPIECPS